MIVFNRPKKKKKKKEQMISFIIILITKLKEIRSILKKKTENNVIGSNQLVNFHAEREKEKELKLETSR